MNSWRNQFFRSSVPVLAGLVSLLANLPPALATASTPAAPWQAVAPPLSFEANLGQYGPGPAFVSRGPAYGLTLAPTEVCVVVQKVTRSDSAAGGMIRPRAATVEYRQLRIELLDANPQAEMRGVDATPGRAHYFLGNDPAQWQRNVPTYQRVRVTDVYPGIHLVHYGNEQQLEYDFEVMPGADPDRIALRFTGADQLFIEPGSGELVMRLGAEELRQPKPVIFQDVNGQRNIIPGGYVLADARTVKFELGAYDPERPLIIDPIISYAEYFSDRTTDKIWAIAVGENADVYVAGETITTSGLATTGAFQTNLAGVLAGRGDVMVARLKNASSERVYATYLGGWAYEAAFGLAVDAEGCAYVTGFTASTNFPIYSAIQSNIAGGKIPGFSVPALDAFITKLDPYGSNLVFSTFYGGSGTGYFGSGDDIGVGVALDASNNVYVAGYTAATNFPTFNTSRTNLSGLEDAFLLKLDAAGTNVIYSMLIGGAGRDYSRDVAVGPEGRPVLIGHTASRDFPVTPDALQSFLNGVTNVSFAEDVFIVQAQADAGELVYATYLGGTNLDQATRVAIDPSGSIYVAGLTHSGDFPRTSTNFVSAILTNTANADAFVVKLNPALTNLEYAVTFGGTGQDEARGLAVNDAGEAMVAGMTRSTNFPVQPFSSAWMLNYNYGGSDWLMAQLNADASEFLFSGYLGESGDDFATAVARDAGDNFYVVGSVTNKPFLVKLLTPTELAIESAGDTDLAVSWPAYAPDFSLQTSTNLALTNGWTTVFPERSITNGHIQVTLPATNPAGYFRLRATGL
jgi:hypothetical protein